MDILNNSKGKETSKPETEQVQKEKQEYKMLDRFLIRRGQLLFSYNYMKDEIKEVKYRDKNEIHIKHNEKGELLPVDLGLEEAEVDSKNEHFWALNWKNAEKRVRNYKAGKIKKLGNLVKSNPEGIKLW